MSAWGNSFPDRTGKSYMTQIVSEKRVRPLPAPAILLILHAKMPASTGYLVLYVLTLGLGDASARTGARRDEDASGQVSQSRWWLLCASVLGVIPTRGRQSQQPDLSGM